jgi:hypothetical protein
MAVMGMAVMGMAVMGAVMYVFMRVVLYGYDCTFRKIKKKLVRLCYSQMFYP